MGEDPHSDLWSGMAIPSGPAGARDQLGSPRLTFRGFSCVGRRVSGDPASRSPHRQQTSPLINPPRSAFRVLGFGVLMLIRFLDPGRARAVLLPSLQRVLRADIAGQISTRAARICAAAASSVSEIFAGFALAVL